MAFNTTDSPELYRYVFVRSTGSDAVMKGYFVTATGEQLTGLQTFTISTSPLTFVDLYGAALPTHAKGFVCTLATSGVYVGLGGELNGDVKSGMTPAAGYPIAAIGDHLTFGKVA
jgi:hypothetical protein